MWRAVQREGGNWQRAGDGNGRVTIIHGNKNASLMIFEHFAWLILSPCIAAGPMSAPSGLHWSYVKTATKKTLYKVSKA